MKVGLFKRASSYLFDVMSIILVLSLFFTLFIGNMLEPEGLDQAISEYNTTYALYNKKTDRIQEEFDNDVISEEVYNTQLDQVSEDFLEDTKAASEIRIIYVFRVFVYYFGSLMLLYYVYSVVTKGRTIGRRLHKIELQGNVNWWTLLVREVFFKHLYYLSTLFVFGILIDFIFILVTTRNKAPRDFLTSIRVTHEGVDYPF
ncbi:MAG: RDD family protein [Candidatus Izimaplasma sp.]|nr:RDD family protein [Candidatus Izimaplasma bacterium]